MFAVWPAAMAQLRGSQDVGRFADFAVFEDLSLGVLPALGARCQKRSSSLAAGSADAIPVLSQALLDPNPNIRRGAAESLGIIGIRAKDAIPDLVEALKDPASSVRIAAAKALENIHRAKH